PDVRPVAGLLSAVLFHIRETVHRTVATAAAMALGTSATARAAAGCASLQRGHAKGLVSMDRGWVHTLRWGPATKIHYGRHSAQRRWYVYRPLRHGEHRGHDCYRHQRRSRNLYGRSGLHGHTVSHRRPKL